MQNKLTREEVLVNAIASGVNISTDVFYGTSDGAVFESALRASENRVSKNLTLYTYAKDELSNLKAEEVQEEEKVVKKSKK